MSSTGLPRSGVYLQNLLDHIKVFICNLHFAHHTDPALYIEFQRDGSAYKDDPIYAGSQFSSTNVRRVTKFLHDAGYIELNTGCAGSSECKVQASKMRPTSKLVAFMDASTADPDTVYTMSSGTRQLHSGCSIRH